MVRTGRQLVVWLHVVSSVGWMSQAAALLVLSTAGALADAGPAKVASAWAAELLDSHLLVYFANTSAFTGFLLAAATPWGFFRHWWVAAKFALTVVQLYAGIFVLSGALHATVVAASAGVDGPVVGVAVGAGLMASALAFQTWLSVARPWGRTPRSPGRGATAPAWLFAAGVAAAVTDVVVGTVLGHPLPVASVAVLVVALVVRARSAPARRPQPVSASSRP